MKSERPLDVFLWIIQGKFYGKRGFSWWKYSMRKFVCDKSFYEKAKAAMLRLIKWWKTFIELIFEKSRKVEKLICIWIEFYIVCLGELSFSFSIGLKSINIKSTPERHKFHLHKSSIGSSNSRECLIKRE